MRLKKLDIIGFKSFHDKVTVDFPPGVSAVVGPNGCGKSNIIDALRWVMGEQSAKQLRGKSMEDVIFAGTRGKPALNLAEVTLTLANDDGSGPAEFKDFSEISISRRQFRSGERAYFINRQPCRLKDVFNVFLGSGMGAKSYAIIQQGNIGAITDAGPEERRVFIEEAAGITRFKARKQEALGKVQATDQNLLRLDDILGEIKRQMGSLQRQAKKALLYRDYQQRLRRLDLTLVLRQHRDLGGQIDEIQTRLDACRDADQAHLSALRQIEAATARIRFERTRAEEAATEERQRRFDLQRTMDRLEAELAHRREERIRLARESQEAGAARAEILGKNRAIGDEIGQVESALAQQRQETESLSQAIEAERQTSEALRRQQSETAAALSDANNRLMDLATREARQRHMQQSAALNRDQIQRRLRLLDEQVCLQRAKVSEMAGAEKTAQEKMERIGTDLAGASARIAGLHQALEACHQTLAAQVREVQSLQFESGKLCTRYDALKKMEDNLEWYRDGVRSVLQAARSSNPEIRVAGILADILTPDPQFTLATEAVLGEALQYLLVPSIRDALAAVAHLRRTRGGRAGFILLDRFQSTNSAASAPRDRLLNHIRVQPGFETLAEALLGRICLVRDLEVHQLSADPAHPMAVVTPQGDAVTAQGIVTGGSSQELSGILAKKRELREMEAQMAALDQRLTRSLARQAELEEAARIQQASLRQQTAVKQQLAEDALQAEKALYRIGEELRHARRHLEVLDLEHEQLQGDEGEAQDRLRVLERETVQIGLEIRNHQDVVARLSAEAQGGSEQLRHFDQRIVELKLRHTAVAAGYDNSRKTLERLRQFQEDGRRRIEQLDRRLIAQNERQDAIEAQTRQTADALETHRRDLERLAADIAVRDTELAALQVRLEGQDAQATRVRAQRNAGLEHIQALELDLSRHQVRRDMLVQRLADSYQQDLAAAAAECRQADDQAALAQRPLEELEKEIQTLRERLAAITDVHLGAIQEFDHLKERQEFLAAQRADLVKALEDLHKMIRKINQVTQERFIQTLDQVNERLQEVFPRLFEGGSGRLVMTEPENPLETGVEFLIHPPGKKLTRMSLLSGGEKAMAAIAFIFSIFLIKPASFCLLDEIDAPLDDANVLRYNNLLRLIGERSQIVMITHNKRSMEFADTLFGVTMPQKGISKIVSVNLQKTAQAA
jgi:chromosome segregation protein